MEFLTLQEVVDVPLCIDSPGPAALEAGLALCRSKSMVNSITAEKGRWELVLPLVKEYKTKVVALCMDDRGMQKSISDRLQVDNELITGLVETGICEDDIYLDLLIT